MFATSFGTTSVVGSVNSTQHGGAWATDFNPSPIGYTWYGDSGEALILHVQTAAAANFQFFGWVEIWWKRSVSPAPPAASFGDVPTDHPFFQFIEALKASGITGGCGNNNFCPDVAGDARADGDLPREGARSALGGPGGAAGGHRSPASRTNSSAPFGRVRGRSGSFRTAAQLLRPFENVPLVPPHRAASSPLLRGRTRSAPGWSTSARISSVSTSRGPGRLKYWFPSHR